MFVDDDFLPVQVTHNHAYHRGIQSEFFAQLLLGNGSDFVLLSNLF